MQGNMIYREKLGGWDVIAALLGLGVMVGIEFLQPDRWP
jgi:hypothetical protein